jgi:hypothetical protein
MSRKKLPWNAKTMIIPVRYCYKKDAMPVTEGFVSGARSVSGKSHAEGGTLFPVVWWTNIICFFL